MAETFLYLTTVGRVTGNPHDIEIWYVEHEGCYYLCAEHRDKTDWVKNIQKTPAIQFCVMERGQAIPKQAGSGCIVTDEATIAAVSRLFDEKYKWSTGLLVEICADGSV
jgi:hypothetical protein